MEQGALLVEQEIDGYRPLGAFGQPVHRSYVQLRAAVAQRLNGRCANLFARPQYDERSRRIRWVSPVEGEPRNWRDLDPKEQAELALELQILKGEFEGYLTELRGAGGESGGEAFASVLEQSLKTPNDGHLHFVGDQPVMTFWGFTELNGDAFNALNAAPRPTPSGVHAAAGDAAGDAAGTVARGWRIAAWLPWLLGALLLLLLLLFLLWYFWDERAPPESLPAEPRTGAETQLPPDQGLRVDPDRVRPDGRPVIVDREGRVVDPGTLRVDEQGRVVGPDGRVIDGATPEQLGLVPDEGGSATQPPELAPATDPEGGTEDAAPLEDPEHATPEPEATTPEPEATTPEPEEATPAPEAEPLPPEPSEDQEAGMAPEGDPAASDEEAAPAEQAATDERTPAEPPAPEEAGDAAESPAGEPLTLPPQEPGTTGEPGAAGADGGSTPANFMRGQWLSRSELTDEQGNRLQQTYRFDESGNGQSVIRRADGTECTAPAQARMQGGSLHITEQEKPTCPDGQRFQKSETVCETDASGQTRCEGNGYDVQIERVGQ